MGGKKWGQEMSMRVKRRHLLSMVLGKGWLVTVAVAGAILYRVNSCPAVVATPLGTIVTWVGGHLDSSGGLSWLSRER